MALESRNIFVFIFWMFIFDKLQQYDINNKVVCVSTEDSDQYWHHFSMAPDMVVDSSGRLFIKLRSYEDFHGLNTNGNCCDGPNPSGGGCKPCDHFIVACLKDNRDHGIGPCISNIVTSDTVQDSNNITFGQSVGNDTNPFVLKFTIPTRNLELSFSYYDDDRVDTPVGGTELLENTTVVVYAVTPDHYTPNYPVLTNDTIPTNNSRLLFDYNLQCDEHYFGKCDRYCMPDTVRYTCSSSGRPVCNPGWSDKNCSTFDFCSNTTCMNGATCQSTKNDFQCQCLGNYTGRHCSTFDFCSNTTCKSGATCQSTKNDFQCQCLGNYTGRYCETQVTILTGTTTDNISQSTLSELNQRGKDNGSDDNSAAMYAGTGIGIVLAVALATVTV